MSNHGDGHITLSFGYGPFKTNVKVHGGPFRAAPFEVMHTVNLREEQPHGKANQFFPIKDFGVPRMFYTGDHLRRMVESALQDGEIYVGCAGGTGRTGLVLALLARVAGVSDPVRFVRDTYKSHAVETAEQERFVQGFHGDEVQEIRRHANREGMKQAILRPFRGLFQ